jgi:hypothetical protein
MGEMLLRHHFPSLKRCDFCHHAVKSMYFVKLGDDLTIQVCSGVCAEKARANYQQKKDLGIKPGTPNLEPEEPETMPDFSDGEDYE